MNKKLKVLIATGGTGGHLFPARQLKNALLKEEVLFAGHRLKKSPFFDQNEPFVEVVSAKSLKNFPKLLVGFFQSIWLIFKFRPDIVVGFGSFHSFPILLAAAFLRRKIVLFEANCTLGKVNQFFSHFAKKVAFQFPVIHKKASYVPLLPWGKKCGCKKKYEKDEKRVTLLVFGGSQGADFLNRIFPEVAKMLQFDCRIIHLTGKTSIEVSYPFPNLVKEFEEEMDALYEIADIVICRAGAGTVSELICHKKPSVMIPYPYAHGHQIENARFLGAKIVEQKDATPQALASAIEHVKNHREEYKRAFQNIEFPQTIPMHELVLNIGRAKL